MSAAMLIERLQRVSQHGNDRWRAVCPAHESKHRTQSLAVRELGDGRLLIRCHAGCGASEIVAAVGLALGDLFPKDHSGPSNNLKSQRPGHWHAMRQAVQTMHHECLVVAIAAADIAAGRALSTADAERVALAAVRVREAIEACR
jgi:hypothetical protein